MKETEYKKSAVNILRGFKQLGVSIVHTIENHPACTALVISLVFNVVLFVSMAQAKVERDKYNIEATTAEMKLDSINNLIRK